MTALLRPVEPAPGRTEKTLATGPAPQ
jgi:hypothetical protein